MGETHSGYCRKEKEIAEMHTDLKMIKGIVMGNGKDGLIVSVPKLTDTVDRLNISVSNLDRNIDKIFQKQDQYEGEKTGKAEVRRRTRWLVGILIGVITCLIAGLIATIHLLAQSGSVT